MASTNSVPGPHSEHRGLTYWMERVLKELEGVRAAPEPDAVHDLRVALRRCRSVAAVMEEVDADPVWPEMRKLGRKIFRQLGELRDTQVLEDWVKKLSPSEEDAIGQRLRESLGARENELRDAALRVAEKFDQKAWRKLERRLRARARLVAADGPVAEVLALERLEAARELHANALRTGRPKAWHELRIGVKRFRYAVESLLPTRYEAWEGELKRLQDLLGDVHDLDVLAATIEEGETQESAEVRGAWKERITSERQQRIETYRQLAVGKTGLWQTWRQALPEGKQLESGVMARLRVTAKALDGKPNRTSQVSRVALRLLDGLRRVKAVNGFGGEDVRKLLTAAARLHAIGSGLDGPHPQKAARDYLRKMVVPLGWTAEEWDLLVNVVRYHRGTLPNGKHKMFARLTEEQKKIVSVLAGILRLARVLRKCGVASATGIQVEKSVDAVIVHLPGLEESEQAAARVAAGKYLLESALGTPLILKAAAAKPKVVELPRREEAADEAAAASD